MCDCDCDCIQYNYDGMRIFKINSHDENVSRFPNNKIVTAKYNA